MIQIKKGTICARANDADNESDQEDDEGVDEEEDEAEDKEEDEDEDFPSERRPPHLGQNV